MTNRLLTCLALALSACGGDTEPMPAPVTPQLIVGADGSVSCVGSPGLYGDAVEAYRMRPEGFAVEWGLYDVFGESLVIRWTATSSLAPEGFDTLKLVIPGVISKPPGLLLQDADGFFFRDPLPPGQLRDGTTWRAVVLDQVRIGGALSGCIAADVVTPDGGRADLVAVWSGTAASR